LFKAVAGTKAGAELFRLVELRPEIVLLVIEFLFISVLLRFANELLSLLIDLCNLISGLPDYIVTLDFSLLFYFGFEREPEAFP